MKIKEFVIINRKTKAADKHMNMVIFAVLMEGHCNGMKEVIIKAYSIQLYMPFKKINYGLL